MKAYITLILFTLSLSVGAQTSTEISDKLLELYTAGSFTEAISLSDKAIKTDSLNAGGYILRALALQGARKYAESIEACDDGLKKFPNNSGLCTTKGTMLVEYSEFDEGIKWHNLAYNYATTDTAKLAVLVNRSAAYSMVRKFDEAYEDLMEAYKIDSNDIGVCINLGGVMDEIGKGDSTLYYFYRVLEIDSTNIDIYNNIGFKLQNMGDHKGAIVCFDKILEASSGEGGADAFAFSNRSYSKLQIGDTKGAMEDINQSIKLYPLNSWAYRNKGLIYVAMGKNDKACEQFMEALEKGFTQMYGDEVMKLYKTYCQN